MINLVQHAGHQIELKVSDDQEMLNVYCWSCHDTRYSQLVGSFILNEREGEDE